MGVTGWEPPKRTVTPSRRMARTNQVIDKKMAVAVADQGGPEPFDLLAE